MVFIPGLYLELYDCGHRRPPQSVLRLEGSLFSASSYLFGVILLLVVYV